MKTQKKKALEAKGFKVGSAEEFLSPNHISVICKKEDFENSRYSDNHDCALARTLKRRGHSLDGYFEGKEYVPGGVGSCDVPIDGAEYFIVEEQEICDTYKDPKDLQVNLLLI